MPRTASDVSVRGSGISASLEPPETNSHPRCSAGVLALPAETMCQRLLHGGERSRRLVIMSAFVDSGSPDLERRVRRLAECCAHPLICSTADGGVAIAPGHCRDRLCPKCATLRGRDVARKIAKVVAPMDDVRFLTLTRVHDDADLLTAVVQIWIAFRLLRRTKEWERHVVGGVAVMEVTRNAKTGRWHVHLHLLIDGSFWRQRDISEAWRRASGGSVIVDIRRVGARAAACRYVATYMAKPAAVEHWPPAAIAEYAQALHGRRLVATFGTIHGQGVDDAEDHGRAKAVGVLCSVTRMDFAARMGSPVAREALYLLARADRRYAPLAQQHGVVVSLPSPPLTPPDLARLYELCRRIGDRSDYAATDFLPVPPPRPPPPPEQLLWANVVTCYAD